MAQITEARLFEMLGRLFAEVQATTAENTQLKTLVAQLQAPPPKKGKGKS
ncbi:hypothetical protein LCGC14_0382760 [marine sediment metagenome]|uniref:Uncharacterized protein n=1 Tax=marine sediment metagenome TaxID=412755 RepID=A0A0F9TK86_9ZZZZ